MFKIALMVLGYAFSYMTETNICGVCSYKHNANMISMLLAFIAIHLLIAIFDKNMLGSI